MLQGPWLVAMVFLLPWLSESERGFSFPLVLSDIPLVSPSPAPTEPVLGLTRVSASPSVCLEPSLQVPCLALVGALSQADINSVTVTNTL